MNMPSKRVVVLVSSKGDILAYLESDRDEFAPAATYDRDRVFSLMFQGDLTSLPGMSSPNGISVIGAVYQEVDTWRINTRSINKPKPRERRRKSAKILHFPARNAGAA